MAEIEEVSVGSAAADCLGAWRGINGVSLGTDGDFAAIADAHRGLLAPDRGPPVAGRDWTQDGTVSHQGLSACGVRGGAQLTMDFVLVGREPELVKMAVGSFQFEDVIGGQRRGLVG